ncbi:MAG: metallophosphoesterase family protein [Candidatus Heimdallarchaeota archaeon]
MPPVAVISDIHANLSALRAVLADIHVQRISRIFCLGDLVGYFAEPIPVIHLVLGRCEIVIKGNHDVAAITGDVPEHYRDESHQPLTITHGLLTVRERKILNDLPTQVTTNCGDKNIMLIHAGPEYPYDQYIYPNNKEDLHSTFSYMKMLNVDVLFLGHTHVPFKAELEGRIICNPGSVGQPRDGDARASYAIYDSSQHDITFRRLEYDPTQTIMHIQKNLPEEMSKELVERLMAGK